MRLSEDWIVDENTIRTMDGGYICKTVNGFVGTTKDLERIVACVNACAGLTTEALEEGIVLDSVKLHEAILDQQPSSFFKEYGVKVWEEEK